LSYSVSISGHGADGATVERVTKEALVKLREAEGATAGATGSGTGPDGASFSFSVRSDEEIDGEAES
jgi:hypothetical protein